jgi:hypothetical protein
MAHGPRTKTCAECGRGFRHGRYLAYCSRLCERTAGLKAIARREAARAVVGLALGLELSEVWLDRAGPGGDVRFSHSLPPDEAERAEAIAAIAGSLEEEAVSGRDTSRRPPARRVDNQLGARLLSEHRALVEEAAAVLLGASGLENLAQELTDLIRYGAERFRS